MAAICCHKVLIEQRFLGRDGMRSLIETNEPVLLSYVESLLRGAGIEATVLDRHMSLIEGSIGVLPRRVMVGEDDFHAAAELLRGAGLGQWVSDDAE